LFHTIAHCKLTFAKIRDDNDNDDADDVDDDSSSNDCCYNYTTIAVYLKVLKFI